MPYNKIADRKGHQGWMKREGEYFTFPGGGTMFPGGAGQYIEKLSQYIPLMGGVLRTALDMGCGVRNNHHCYYSFFFFYIHVFCYNIIYKPFAGRKFWRYSTVSRDSSSLLCSKRLT